MIAFSYFSFLITYFFNYGCADLTPVVQTRNGPLRGVIEESEDGVIYKYMGIPYGSVNPNNKFGDPDPAPTWEETFEASSDEVFCPQREEFYQGLVGDPDCLTLNVYTPEKNSSDERFPVMVYTHGGGFEYGYAAQYLLGPEKIVRHDVVFVTMNYRLGPYGFMCFGDDQVPGNAGVMDVALAFNWINENIESFGGDINSITAFGNSAGAYITEYLMLVPSTSNLFHKVILQSGAIVLDTLRGNYDSDREAAFALANALGFEGTNLDEVIPFLSNISGGEMIKAYEDLNLSLRPCLEVLSEGKERLLYQQPMDFYASEDFMSKPIILGVTDKETMMRVNTMKNLFEETDPIWEAEVYALLNQFHFGSNEEQERVARILRQFYFADDAITMDGMIDMYSDERRIYSTDASVSLYFEKTRERVYHFVFAYDGDRNFVKRRFNVSYEGAAHADELSYLFLQPFWGGITDRDRIIMDRMTTMWTNFAKFSDPTPDINELLPVKWAPVEQNVKNFLHIDSEMRLGKRAFSDRMAFWDLIHKNYGTPVESGSLRRQFSMLGLIFILCLNLIVL